MAYWFVDHTAELQLEIEAATRTEVLEEAVLALAELLGRDAAEEAETVARDLAVSAADDPALLAAWIDEVVFVSERDGLVPRRADGVVARDGTAHGTVVFVRRAPPHLVKGVTYHDLQLAREGALWRGRVVLDV